MPETVPNSSGNLVIDQIICNGLRWSASELIEVSGNAGQHPEHPRAVKPNERRLRGRIRSRIYHHFFALICQVCLELGLR